MTRQGYIRRQKALQNRLMKKHLPAIYAALQYQVGETAAIVQSDGIDAALQKTYRDHYINPKIGAAVTSLYQDAGQQSAAKFRLQKSLVIPLVGFVKDVIAYFNAFLLEKVVLPISQSMVNQIQTVLKQAISDGWGVEKTVSELKNSEITKRRAKTIVRTESVRAMNYAQLRAADNEKFQVEKTWIATEDSRTRFMHGHQGVDGEVRDLYDAFANGLQFPGDPSGSAAEVINCRCTMSYKIKRDLSGNPVRKVPQRVPAYAFADKYNPDEPRVPAGNPTGGQWVSDEYTEQETADAIRTYQGVAFDSINNELRYGKPEKYKKIISILDKASTDRTSDKLYRGLTSDYAAELKNRYKISDLNDIDELKLKLIGKELRDKAFMSTTRSLNSAVYFTRDTGFGKVTVMEISGHKTGIEVSKHLSGVTSNTEKEFIVRRGSTVIVDDVSLSKTGKLILYTHVK